MLWPVIADSVPKVRNYRGVEVGVGLGVVWLMWTVAIALVSRLAPAVVPVVAMASDTAVWNAMWPGREFAWPLVLGAFAFGFVDDMFGDRSVRGFRGHLAEMRRGKLTTGGLKLLGIGLLAAAFAADSSQVAGGAAEAMGPVIPFLTWLLATVVIATSANFVNLLDLRPGRALKGYSALAVIGCLASGVATWELIGAGAGGVSVPAPVLALAAVAAIAVFVLGPVVAVWRYDLGERGMLGDAGANAMGALAGYLLVVQPAALGARDRRGGPGLPQHRQREGIVLRGHRAQRVPVVAGRARQRARKGACARQRARVGFGRIGCGQREGRRGAAVMTKHIFVTGGVTSSLGKGITAASLGRLLKSRGLKVTIQKLDPYLNVDPGTMSPFQHGEVFVTDDGGETDLDLGHYERFIDESLSRDCNVTAGSVYSTIVTKERRGRLPRRHRPGHPARDQRDQGTHHPAGRADRTRRDHHRGRRHGRRHRVAALPRGDPPTEEGRRPLQRLLHPRDPGALHRRRQRAQDQTHAALRQGAASDRHPARLHRLPLGQADRRRSEAQDRPVLRRGRGRGRVGAGRPLDLRGARQPAASGPRRDGHRTPGSGVRQAGHGRVELLRPPQPVAHRHPADRPRGQVRPAARRIPLGQRVAEARRHLPRPRRQHPLGGRGGHHSRGGRPDPDRDGRHPRARRVRGARHRGQDTRRLLCTDEQGSVLGHMSGYASGGLRVRAKRRRPRERQLHRVRPCHPPSGHRSDGDPGRRARHGRHDAPRQLRLQGGGGQQGLGRPTAKRSSTSAIVTGTRSTTPTATG